jgi:hypothetical protein
MTKVFRLVTAGNEVAIPTKRPAILKRMFFAIILMSATIVGNSYAQEKKTVITNEFHDKITTGLKIGANYSNVYDRSGDQFNTRALPGFAAGGFVSVPIVPYISFQPEILFSQKGFHATGNILNSTYDITRTTSYIDVPLLFALVPCRFITVLLGPQYSLLVHQRDVFTNATTGIEEQQLFLDDNARKNALCFTGGVDLNFNHIVVGARAGIDMLNNKNNGTSSSTPNYKNDWMQLTLGYRFYH